jgi:hypothetical protein
MHDEICIRFNERDCANKTLAKQSGQSLLMARGHLACGPAKSEQQSKRGASDVSTERRMERTIERQGESEEEGNRDGEEKAERRRLRDSGERSENVYLQLTNKG